MIGKQDDISLVDAVEHARQVTLKKIEFLSKKILEEEVYPKGRAYWLKNN